MRVDGHLGSIEFEGQRVEIKKKLRGSTVVLLPHISGVTIEHAGIGMRAIRVSVGGGPGTRQQVALGSHSDASQDPYALTFKKKHLAAFEELREQILTAAAEL